MWFVLVPQKIECSVVLLVGHSLAVEGRVSNTCPCVDPSDGPEENIQHGQKFMWIWATLASCRAVSSASMPARLSTSIWTRSTFSTSLSRDLPTYLRVFHTLELWLDLEIFHNPLHFYNISLILSVPVKMDRIWLLTGVRHNIDWVELSSPGRWKGVHARAVAVWASPCSVGVTNAIGSSNERTVTGRVRARGSSSTCHRSGSTRGHVRVGGFIGINVLTGAFEPLMTIVGCSGQASGLLSELVLIKPWLWDAIPLMVLPESAEAPPLSLMVLIRS